MLKILSPYDFSKAANNAVEYAANFARDNRGELTLVHVAEEVVELDRPVNEQLVIERDNRTILARKLIVLCREITEEFGVVCNYHIDHQSLEKAIQSYADDFKFDLVIMGTDGEDNIYKYYFGTNSYRVAKKSNTPVLVVPVESMYNPVNEIIYASDYLPGDDIAIGKVKQLFSEREPAITVLHVSPKDSFPSRAAFEDFKDKIMDIFGPDDQIKFTRQIIRNIAEGIDNYMFESRADLLAMTIEYRMVSSQMFQKSITKKVIALADYPVMIFPE